MDAVVCRFYVSSTGCKFGKRCYFPHVKSKHRRPDTICRYFVVGRCVFGAECWHDHEMVLINPASSRSDAAVAYGLCEIYHNNPLDMRNHEVDCVSTNFLSTSSILSNSSSPEAITSSKNNSQKHVGIGEGVSFYAMQDNSADMPDNHDPDPTTHLSTSRIWQNNASPEAINLSKKSSPENDGICENISFWSDINFGRHNYISPDNCKEIANRNFNIQIPNHPTLGSHNENNESYSSLEAHQNCQVCISNESDICTEQCNGLHYANNIHLQTNIACPSALYMENEYINVYNDGCSKYEKLYDDFNSNPELLHSLSNETDPGGSIACFDNESMSNPPPRHWKQKNCLANKEDNERNCECSRNENQSIIPVSKRKSSTKFNVKDGLNSYHYTTDISQLVTEPDGFDGNGQICPQISNCTYRQRRSKGKFRCKSDDIAGRTSITESISDPGKKSNLKYKETHFRTKFQSKGRCNGSGRFYRKDKRRKDFEKGHKKSAQIFRGAESVQNSWTCYQSATSFPVQVENIFASPSARLRAIFANPSSSLHPTTSSPAKVVERDETNSLSSGIESLDLTEENNFDRDEHVRVFTPFSKQRCFLCLEIVTGRDRSDRIQGILENCDHIYCLKCIYWWRSVCNCITNTYSVSVSCPTCFTKSRFIVPSKSSIAKAIDKLELVERYKKMLNRVHCRFFRGGKGYCQFGDSCLYLHRCAEADKRYNLPRN